jgi:hypothetical protein
MTLLADRRTRLRYEVVGVLRGTLEISEPARVTNISGDGALIETAVPLTVGSLQSLQVTLMGRCSRVTSRVRHVTQIGGPRQNEFAVGVEFLSPPDTLTACVANLIAEIQPD